jgi:hypothetical protein
VTITPAKANTEASRRRFSDRMFTENIDSGIIGFNSFRTCEDAKKLGKSA